MIYVKLTVIAEKFGVTLVMLTNYFKFSTFFSDYAKLTVIAAEYTLEKYF